MPAKKAPKQVHTLTSLRQVRALAHPLRLRAFECLIDVPRTGKQLATMLRKQPTHLYHHLRVLEQAGLIRQVATRKKRGTTERYFQAVSERVVFDQRLFGGTAVAKHALIGQVFRLTFDEFVEAEAVAAKMSPKPSVLVKRLRIRSTAARVGQLERRLERWLSDFESASEPQAESEFAVTVALYPVGITGH